MIKIELQDAGLTEITLSDDGAISIDEVSRPTYGVHAHHEIIGKLVKRVHDLEKEMRIFVQRVDKGEVRSTKTYNTFKTLLGDSE